MIRPVFTNYLTGLIPIGKQEAISMTSLSKLTGQPSSEVRLMILNARTVGILICSCDKGYYFPKNDDELKDYVKRRKQYIRTANIALKLFEDELKKREEGDP